MVNGNAKIIVGSVGASRRFFLCVKSYFIQLIVNQLPETGFIMSWLRLFEFAERAVV